MEANVEEVTKLEEHFEGLQIEHVPRAENNVASHLSKCAAQKLPVEPGTFVLHLTQPSESPSMMARKRRKLSFGKYLPAGLPRATGREAAGNNSTLVGEQHSRAEPVLMRVNFPSQKTARSFFGTVFTPIFKPFVRMRHVIYHWKAMD